jgi:hypothetical protein
LIIAKDNFTRFSSDGKLVQAALSQSLHDLVQQIFTWLNFAL